MDTFMVAFVPNTRDAKDYLNERSEFKQFELL